MGLFKRLSGTEPGLGAGQDALTPGLGGEQGAEQLAHALHDKDKRIEAIQGLIQLGSSAVQPMVRRLNHKNKYVRDAAAFVLGKVGDETVISELVVCLQDEDPGVREVGAYALGHIKSVRAVPALINALNDRDHRVVNAATYALCRIEMPTELEQLITTWPSEQRGQG